MDALNITVGLASLGLAVLSLVLSLKWSNEAARNLDRANAALEEVRRETSNVTRAVDERLRDLIDRVVPSTQDQFAGQAMTAVLTGDLDLEKLMKIVALADQLPTPGRPAAASPRNR